MLYMGNVEKKTGVTFVELLVVTCLLAALSLATYSLISAGVRVYKKVNSDVPSIEAAIFLERFSFDLRNSFTYKDIEFTGSREKFECAAFVDSAKLGVRTVGKVAYIYDAFSGMLRRRISNYSQAYSGGYETEQELPDVASLKFSYYYYAKEKDEYLWLEEWTEKKLPLAVRVEFEVARDGHSASYIKTVSIPCARYD